MLEASLILAILLMTTGAWNIRRWQTGRRLDTHPVCTQCNFDLSGIPYETRCPECGTDTSRWGARRRGNHDRKQFQLTGGIALCILAIPIAALPILQRMDIAWATRAAPTRYLAWTAVWSSGKDDQARALLEIRSRISARKLAASDVNGLINDILNRQADPTFNWRPYWGDIIEDLRAAGLVTNDQWRHYMSQAATVAIHIDDAPSDYLYDLANSVTIHPRAASVGTLHFSLTGTTSVGLADFPIRFTNLSYPNWGGRLCDGDSTVHWSSNSAGMGSVLQGAAPNAKVSATITLTVFDSSHSVPAAVSVTGTTSK